MHAILSDLKLTYRQLRKSPKFTITAVFILALGIGSTTAIYSIVHGVLLRPLPFPHPEQLVTLGDQVSGTDWGHTDPGPVTGPEVMIYPRETRSFQSLGGYGYAGFELSGISQPAQITAFRMTPSIFTALEISPMMGRVFTEAEDKQRAQVAVLSFATWKSRFGGSPQVLGTKILLDRKPYVVIGVMPRDFEFPLVEGQLYRPELWVPMSLTPQEVSSEASSSWYLNLVGRLKPGVSLAQAQSDAGRVAQEIMRNYPPDAQNFRIHPVVYPLQAITVLEVRPLLRMLFLAVSVVLLIACANLAGLLLVRAIRRQHETAVRLAIGASGRTILTQMILESLVLSLAGGIIGIGMAALALTLGRNFLPETLPRMNEISLDWNVVGFSLLLAIVTGFLCGLAPGFAALKTNICNMMKEGSRTGSGSGSHARLRSALVVVEIAVALVLLASSGLFLRSFANMSAVDLGFRPDHVMTASYSLPRKEYSKQEQLDNFNRRLVEQLKQLPGVQSVGITSTLPMSGSGISAFVVQGYVDPRGPDQTAAPLIVVQDDYFQAIGMRLLRGRYFTEEDNPTSQLAVIVNREFAEHYWPHQDPIGKQLRVGTQKANTPWLTVIGEVADAKLSRADEDAQEQYFLPLKQLAKADGAYTTPTDLFGDGGTIVLRSALPPEQMKNALRATVHSLDPQLTLSQLQTMDQVVERSSAPRRFNTVVISAFALAAVLLAILGIYSIIAFSAAARTQEVAIRIALGSQKSDILRLVIRSGLKLAAVGTLLGLAGTFAASSILRAFLFHVSPYDPAVMFLAALVVFVLAFAASALPARRAASVDPVQALRSE